MKRADLLLVLVSCVAGLLAVELLLTRFANPNSRPVVRFAGMQHDTRDWLNALYDLRASGTRAYPITSAQVYGQFLAQPNDETSIQPLAGLSRTMTTFCNELSNFIVFQSDRYGFRNNDRLWDDKPPYMLIGDSFGQGACVPDGATIAEQLTSAGLPTIGVTYNSNGPLAELASLVEYGPLIKPKTVIWLYYEGNDPTDLGRELEFAALRKYMEPDFRQNLAQRQPEIDRLIRTALDARPELQNIDAAVADRWSLAGVFSLRNTRVLISAAVSTAREPAAPVAREIDEAVLTPPDDQRYSDIEIVLTRAKEVTGSWGGRLVFAYLPATERYRFPKLPQVVALRNVHAEVTKIATSLDIPVIDLNRAFAPIDGPARLFPKANWPVHLTEEGYRIVSMHLAARLHEVLGR